ncbi:maker630 [Drosophila busckii]|uniref:Maker630 n=1 Tax=Drosophila busckii TaxID=30019 RepID=A0A0M4E7W8_DROBS|nr:serine hydrolase-like protein [Drosophila busckii]ALC42878.1 maker630 [Drosophila busckii]
MASTELEFVDFDIGVPWGRLACRWYGNRRVRPLLAIHGWMDNMGSFSSLIPLLPKQLGVLCIELPGHGRSSHYPAGMQYSVYEWTMAIRRVVRHFQWLKVSLMGHSFGAIACNLYASFYPHEHVDLLIAIDLLTIPYKTSDAYIKYMANSVERMLQPQKQPKLYSHEQLQNARWGPAPTLNKCQAQPLVARSVVAAPEEPHKYYISRDARLAHFSLFPSGAGLVKELNKRISNIPYMVIKCSDSNFISEGSIPALELLRKQNPHFEYHLAQGPHHVLISDPKQLAAWIVPFINKHRPAHKLTDAGHIAQSKL